MARKKIVAGNWKMNKTPSEAVALVEELKTDGTFITLNEKNYNIANTGAKPVDVTAQYAADIEKEHNDASKAKYNARIEEIKKEIFGK